MSSISRVQLENWVKKIDISDKSIVDLGGKQLKVIGRANGRPAQYKCLDLPDYDLNEVQQLKMSVDIAFMLEVSEYLFNPIVALNNIRRLLKAGGILYSSWHFIYKIHKPEHTDFLRYTPDGVKKIHKQTGFLIKEIEERRFKNYNAEALFQAEGMRGYGDPNTQGVLTKAIKL